MSKSQSRISTGIKVTALIAVLVCLASALPGSPIEVSRVVNAQQGCKPGETPFKLVAQQFSKNAPQIDVNGFLLNPQWQWQVDCPPPIVDGKPKPTLENFPDSIDPDMCNSRFTKCSDNQTSFDGVGICPMCNLGRKRKNRELGHVNWFTVTYTGDICFHNRSYPDMDYTFSLIPKMGAGLTRWNHPSKPDQKGVPEDRTKLPLAIHVEFDSRETVNFFRSDLWSKFRDYANPCRWWDFRNPCDEAKAMSMISKRRAVVIGLMGLDSEHDIYSESHPVYAMAIEVNDSLDDNTWIVFARNTGTEGNCSSEEHPLNSDGQLLKTLKLLIPPPLNATVNEVSASSTQFFSNTGTCPELGYYTNDQYSEDNEGVLITFDLQPCTQGNCDSLIEGEIHLNWNVQAAAADAQKAAKPIDKCLIPDQKETKEEGDKYPDPSKTQAAQLMQMLEQERAVGAGRMNRCQTAVNVPIPRVQMSIQQRAQADSPTIIRAVMADKKAATQKVQKHFKKIGDIIFPN